MRRQLKASFARSHAGQGHIAHRSPARALAILAVGVLAALSFFATSALGATTYPYTGTSFGPDGAGGTQSFEHVQGVAVDPASGDVYVYDPPAGAIYKFDSVGAPVNFSATGENKITGVGGSGSSAELQIAVAPPGSPGGTAGDIYVADNSNSILVYSQAGASLGELQLGGETCGVATDSAGNLYAGIYPTTIEKFTPSANPPLSTDQSGTAETKNGICHVGADSLGNVYYAKYTGGFFKLEGLGDTTPIEIDPDATTFAVAPGTDEVFVDHGNEVVVYDSATAEILKFGLGDLPNLQGVATNAGATRAYAGTEKKVKVFGPPATMPNVSAEAATGITKAAATLHGNIGAAGGPAATCVFQYMARGEFASQGFEGAPEAPCSPAGPFTGSSSNAVSAQATGLTLETEYVYRLLASNENGSTGSVPQSFVTPGPVNMTISPATGLTSSTATLNGTVNPEGALLEECSFEYGTGGSFEDTVPCAESPAEIGTGSSPVAVHADLSGLSAATAYQFRLFGKNEFGTSVTPESNFITLSPILEAEALRSVSLSTATFTARVNPNGEETTYAFEYVTEAQFEESGYANAAQVPAGGKAIGNGTTGVEVEQEVTGLAPRTTYHARIAATNAGGTTLGPDMVFTTYTPAATDLPDGRAYEQVTPVDKNGQDAQGIGDTQRAAVEGGGITFHAESGFPGAEGAQYFGNFLSTRAQDGNGWSTYGLFPPASVGPVGRANGVSDDLTRSYSEASQRDGSGNKLYERDTATQAVKEIAELGSGDTGFVAATTNGSRVAFEATASLNASAANGLNVYLWDAEQETTTLASVLNDGQAPAGGTVAGKVNANANIAERSNFSASDTHVLAADGDSVFFTSLPDHKLYLRHNISAPQSPLDGQDRCTAADDACTFELSKSERTTPDPNGPKTAFFQYAAKDASVAFFTSAEALTDDATTGPASEGSDLYAYEFGSEELTDLTPDGVDPNGAEVQEVVGGAADGSTVYFTAQGAVAGNEGVDGTHAEPGINCNEECNLYRWGASGDSAGEVTYVGRIARPTGQPYAERFRVSEDGNILLFESNGRITSYDSQETFEIYRYNAETGEASCVSCNPTGAPPVGPASLDTVVQWGASEEDLYRFETRNLSADGSRVFFQTPDALVSTDVNGDYVTGDDVNGEGCEEVNRAPFPCLDVYEWEAKGTGSCSSEAENGGCLYLISSGTSTEASYFADASKNGDDVYIFTFQSLVGQDKDSLQDIYDARVGGGMASQNPPPKVTCASAEACLAAAGQGPAATSPGTASFSGPGNQAAAKKNKHKKKHVKKHKKKHRKSRNAGTGQGKNGGHK